MKYSIALDPKLDISAVEFIEAWNKSKYNEEASAIVNEDSKASFLSPEITVALITAAVSIPTTIITNFVSEFLKKKYIEKTPPQVSMTCINTPDGQSVLIINRSGE